MMRASLRDVDPHGQLETMSVGDADFGDLRTFNEPALQSHILQSKKLLDHGHQTPLYTILCLYDFIRFDFSFLQKSWKPISDLSHPSVHLQYIIRRAYSSTVFYVAIIKFRNYVFTIEIYIIFKWH